MKEQLYKTSSVTLNYMEGPNNGTPLLLVHGNMSRWQAFDPVIEELARQHHLFALDLRGHGKSSHATGTYILENHMKDVVEFIKYRIAHPVNYLGMSLGGMIGIMSAAHHPDLISKLMIGDSPLTLETLEPIILSQTEMGLSLLSYLKSGQFDKIIEVFDDEAFCESVRLCDIDIIETTFFRYHKMLKGFDIDILLPEIQCPFLIMHGEQQLGSMISDNDLQRSKALKPSLQVLKISGVGHSLLTERQIILNAMKQFIVS